MSTPYPPPYPTSGPDYAGLPNYLTSSPVTAARPYSPWRSALIAWAGGFGLRLAFGFVIGLVAVFSGLATGIAHAEVGFGQVLTVFFALSLVTDVVVALLQGSYLAGRGAQRPYVAALSATGAVVVAGLLVGLVAPAGLTLLIGPVVEIVVIAVVTTHRAPVPA